MSVDRNMQWEGMGQMRVAWVYLQDSDIAEDGFLVGLCAPDAARAAARMAIRWL